MTEEQRLAVIANAYRNSKGLPTNSAVMEFVADIQAEKLVLEHGLKDVEQDDLDELLLPGFLRGISQGFPDY